jgi:cytochrome c biogenesis protein CcdA
MNKLFDLRFVIGLFFTIIGIVILIYSFITTTDTDRQNINQWGSVAFVIFGICMILLSLRKDAHDELMEETSLDDFLS